MINSTSVVSVWAVVVAWTMGWITAAPPIGAAIVAAAATGWFLVAQHRKRQRVRAYNERIDRLFRGDNS